MKTVPKVTLTILIAIGLCIGFVIAVDMVLVDWIGDSGIQYKQGEE